VSTPHNNLRLYRDGLIDEAAEVMARKNIDYGSNDNPYLNFTATEALGLASTETGIVIRMADKLSRLQSFLANGELQCEGYRDALIDIINYCVLLGAYTEGKTK
jgi:hypothetical protein